MLHVAVVNRHPSDAVGGSELQCDLFSRGLVARGHRVTYVALRSPTRREDVTATPYALVRLPPDASGDASAVAAAVRDAGADVVYWRYGRDGLDAVAALLAEGPRAVPVVLAVAHVDDVSRWPSGPLLGADLRTSVAGLRRRVAHRRSWRAFRYVVAIAAQREDFLGRAPVALQRHVPNVVDPTVDAFAWPRPYVAWVANLKARKRPEELVPLARSLAPHGVDLLVVGALQDERYRPLTVADPAVPNLHPLGPLSPAGAAGLIAGARCLAFTARPEGLSNALIQAWWHGVPTVSLEDDPDGAIGAHGLGVAGDGDVEVFREAVVLRATRADVREAEGAEARAYAHGRFALDANVALLESLLEATVSVARPSPTDRGAGRSAPPR